MTKEAGNNAIISAINSIGDPAPAHIFNAKLRLTYDHYLVVREYNATCTVEREDNNTTQRHYCTLQVHLQYK
jgi:hypothetical protein